MNKCLNCQGPTLNPKFCSRSCAAIINNSIHIKKPTVKRCKRCNDIIATNYTQKTLCKNCRKTYVNWSEVTLQEFKQRFKTIFNMNARIRALARQTYKKSDKPKRCSICGYSKFYEVCHVKAIKDFSNDTKVSEVNNINNLISLCPNCHWELDHNLIKVA